MTQCARPRAHQKQCPHRRDYVHERARASGRPGVSHASITFYDGLPEPLGAGILLKRRTYRMYEEPAVITTMDAADLLGDAFGHDPGNGSSMPIY